MLGRRNQFQHRAEFDAVLRPDLRGGDFALDGGKAGHGAQIVAGKDRFERDGGLGALMRGNLGVERGNDFVGRSRFVRQIGRIFEHFPGHGHPRLQSLGLAKIRQQTVLQRRFLRLINDRLGFFQRHDEMTVLFHFAAGGFPPFLPVVADDIGHEHLLNLVRRRLAAVAVQHHLDQIQMMRRHLAQALEVRGLARQDVILGNRLERFGGERQIHRVTRLARKINREPREHRVHRLDPAKAPTAVHAKTARGQFASAVRRAALQSCRRRPISQIPLS